MPQRLRIFVSSPGDVPDERLRADLIVDKLSQDYSRFFNIESYRWEHEAMLASAHFQDAIEPPSAFDIVVLILWSRLGTPLPERTAMREYCGIDGRLPVTGTEWEYEEALAVAREKKAPDLLAFRNISPAPIDPRDSEARAKANAQLDALDEFWRRHFADRGVFLAAYDEYRTLEEFARRLEESLRKLIERRIKDAAAGEGRTEPIWLGAPFRGLDSYEFEHAPIFFGRNTAIAKATEQLAANARAGRAFLLVSGASGSGKSSLVKAGIVPRLMKPQRISGVEFLRRVVLRPGNDSSDVFLSLATALTRTGAPDVGLPELIAPGQDVTQLASHLHGAVGDPGYLFANALGRLTESSRKAGLILGFEDAKLILVVDQLEELFTAPGIEPQERRQFIQLLDGLAQSGAVWVIATLRDDFWHRAAEFRELIALTEGPGRIDLAAPSAAELAAMIGKPAQAAGLSFQAHPQSGLGLDAVLAEHATAEPGALPLLSFTLDELYRSAKARGETVLTHASYQALGGLAGAIAKRADEVMAGLPAPAQAALPRVLRALTTVAGTADQVAVARWASLEGFPDGTPARALIGAFVAARLMVAGAEADALPSVRVAHEALFSRWEKARTQISADLEFLAWRSGLEAARRSWQMAPERSKRDAVLTGFALTQARKWIATRSQDIPEVDRQFILQSGKVARQHRLRVQTVIGTFTATMVLGLAAWWNQDWLKHRLYVMENVHALTAAQVQALKPGESFNECTNCPEMIVVAAGSFVMGSPANEPGHDDTEEPQHTVAIARPFAVAKFELTFTEWAACLADHGCGGYRLPDKGWGRGRRPVIFVSWDDAHQYVAWLAKLTGKPYRLLTEAEYEYAARAGTTTAYFWGNAIGKDDADCDGCGSKWDDNETAAVGSFPANKFGLYDMLGNVDEWTEDCAHETYKGAPANGSAWLTDNGGVCTQRVHRGGSWFSIPESLRSADRSWNSTDFRTFSLGFRVARTLVVP